MDAGMRISKCRNFFKCFLVLTFSDVFTTLNIAFSVTYYLDLCNAITTNYIGISFFSNKGQIGCLDIV